MGCGTSGQTDVHGHTARLQKQERARQQLQSVPLEMSLDSDHWTEEAPLKETMRVLKQIVMVARCGIPEQELLFCDHMVGLWFCGYRLGDDQTVERCQELCSDAQVSVEGVNQAKNAIAARIKEEERVLKKIELEKKFKQFQFVDEDGDTISITRHLSEGQQADMEGVVDPSSQDLPTLTIPDHSMMMVSVSGPRCSDRWTCGYNIHGHVGQWGGFNAQTGTYVAGGGNGVVPSDMRLQLNHWLEMLS